MAEEEKNGVEPAADVMEQPPVQTPLSDIVDKPRLQTDASRIADPAPERKERRPKEAKPVVPEGYVPLREVLDTRDRAKKAEEDRDRYRAWIEDQQRKLAAEQDKDPAPDMFKDPAGYNAWSERQIEKRATAIAEKRFAPLRDQVSDQALMISEMQARNTLGERWTPFNKWLSEQPQEFKDWAMSHDDPYGVAYGQYRQRTTFEKLGSDDLDTYLEKQKKAWLAEQRVPAGAAEPEDDLENDQEPPPKQTPRSFAAGRSAEPKGERFAGPKPLGAILDKSPKRR